MPADTDGQWFPGQACRSAGNGYRDLASGRRSHKYCRNWPRFCQGGAAGATAAALRVQDARSSTSPPSTELPAYNHAHRRAVRSWSGASPSTIDCPAPGHRRSPCGCRCAIGSAEPRPSVRSPEFGAPIEEDQSGAGTIGSSRARTACCHNVSMNIWLTAILPVASALLGVLIANRASRQREATARMWERRADTYVALYDWAEMVDRKITDDNVGLRQDLLPADFAQLAMPDDLVTRMFVFASDPVRYAQGPCRNYQFLLALPTDQVADDPTELLHNLRSSLSALKTVIRNELREGKLTIPLSFRISQRIFPVKRRIRMWRNRRQARERRSGG